MLQNRNSIGLLEFIISRETRSYQNRQESRCRTMIKGTQRYSFFSSRRPRRRQIFEVGGSIIVVVVVVVALKSSLIYSYQHRLPVSSLVLL